MYLNTARVQTLSGQTQGAFDIVRASALSVYGDASVTGTVSASALAGTCITSSLVSTATNIAASANAVNQLYTSTAGALTAAGGTVTGTLT